MDKEKLYEIRCTACDIKTFRKTASGPVKEPERYECTNCGGNGTFEVKYNGELLIYKKKKENKPKYTILCKGCGLMVNKKRASDLTKNISNYNCSNCKGALTLIINH